MKKLLFLHCIITFLTTNTLAQKKVLGYPFEFEKSFLSKSDYDAYFLGDKTSDKIAFILHDNKKASYVLADKNFKVESKFEVKLDATVFNFFEEKYLGGAIGKNNVYYFIYKVLGKKFMGLATYYQVETVDFNTKTVSNKQLFEIPKQEEILLSFSDFGEYYTITTNNKTSEIVIYNLKSNGEVLKKNITIKIPEGKSRSRNELSEYLNKTKLIKDDDEVGLETATQSSKLFSYKNDLVFVVNDGDDATHIITINKDNLSATEKFIDHTPLFSKEEKSKSFVNSFLDGDRLFSLVLNKKNIKVAIYNTINNTLLKSIDISDNDALSSFAKPPVAEQRMGKKIKEKDIDDMKKVIKAFTKGTEGLSVTRNLSGQYILTVGTYDPIATGGGGGGSAGHFTGGYQNNMTTTAVGSSGMTLGSNYNPHMYYTPGIPMHTTGLANYYNSTYFKILLNPATLVATTKGKIPVSINDQIKDYMDETDKKATAKKQFAIGDKQYFGYYDRDSKEYIIENIMIIK